MEKNTAYTQICGDKAIEEVLDGGYSALFLEGRVAVVSGSRKDIGKCIGLVFAEESADLWFVM